MVAPIVEAEELQRLKGTCVHPPFQNLLNHCHDLKALQTSLVSDGTCSPPTVGIENITAYAVARLMCLGSACEANAGSRAIGRPFKKTKSTRSRKSVMCAAVLSYCLMPPEAYARSCE